MSLVRLNDHLFIDPDDVSTIMDDMTNNGEKVPGIFITMKNNQRIGIVGGTLLKVAKVLGYSGIDRV